jgi:hypothetical protein
MLDSVLLRVQDRTFHLAARWGFPVVVNAVPTGLLVLTSFGRELCSYPITALDGLVYKSTHKAVFHCLLCRRVCRVPIAEVMVVRLVAIQVRRSPLREKSDCIQENPDSIRFNAAQTVNFKSLIACNRAVLPIQRHSVPQRFNALRQATF